jgi:hypothetical protein
MEKDASHELTEYSKPDEILKSQYGNTTYREWCERERERINANGGTAVRIVTDAEGRIALSRAA